MKEKIYPRIIAVFSSRKFFYALIGLFILQAAWLAVSGLYPMSFDEGVHLGIIKLYAHRLSPFWSHQPPGIAQFGAVARDPSYLYHYMMSFPYRLIVLIFHTPTSQIIALRCISIVFFVCALIVYRRVLLHTNASKALVGVVFAFIVLTPLMPLIAAQINYDNLLFLLTGITFLIAMKCVWRLKKENTVDVQQLAVLLILCLLTSLVKYAFLPIFVGIFIYVTMLIYKHIRTQNSSRAREYLLDGFKKLNFWVRILLCAGLVLSTGLFIERFGVNLALYGTPIPECNQVLGVEECKADSAWFRNYQTEQDKLARKLPEHSRNPVTFVMSDWIDTMLTHLFFTINGPASGYAVGKPLPIPKLLGEGLAISSVLVVIRYARYIRKHYEVGLLMLVVLIYLAVLGAQNYEDFLHLGYAFGIQGRYLLPILPLLYLLAGLGFSRVLRIWPPAKSILAVGLLGLLAVQGGGIMTFILRSDSSWYWPNATIDGINYAVRNFLNHFVIGS